MQPVEKSLHCRTSALGGPMRPHRSRTKLSAERRHSGIYFPAMSALFHNGVMNRALLLAPLVCIPALFAETVSLNRDGDRIDVAIGGQPFTSFYFGPEATKPYLHPLRTADGTVVTRGYPMEEIEGEQTDHRHHRGAWFSHGDVNSIDFWANEPEQRNRGMKKGIIAHRTIDSVKSGADSGSISATFDWNDLSGRTLVSERRTMDFRRVDGNNVVDFDIVLSAESDSVKFGDTKEGTFAVRIATELEEQHFRAKGIPRTGTITNAHGAKTEANTWGKRSPWVDYAGTLAGKPKGIAIFDHPTNPKHPTYWHVRGYGLFAANIFGEHDFYADASRDGSITVNKGETLRFRYRVVIHQGLGGSEAIEHMFRAWAESM